MTIGQRIKELREQRNWNEKELAGKIKVTQQAVNNWERGANGPRPTSCKKLCEVFKITEAELHGGTPSKIRPEILEALDDQIAVKIFLTAHKNSQDIKNIIKALLETLPSLAPKKRQAIIALCR